MEKEIGKLNLVVTFTFCDSKHLGEYFVESLKDKYGEDNVIHIDQSTYGIINDEVTTNDILLALSKAQEKGEKCKDGDEIKIIRAQMSCEKLLLNQSMIFNARLNGGM